MNLLSQRLRHARKQTGWTVEQAAAHIGLSKYTITAYECGHRRPVPQALAKIARVYGVSTDHLLGVLPLETKEFSRGRCIPIPVISAAHFEGDIFTVDKYKGDRMLDLKSIHVTDPDPEEYYFVEILDNSMSGFRICAGDFAAVHLQSTLPPDSIAYVSIGEGQAMIRRVILSEGCIIVQSSTPDIPTEIFHNEKTSDVHIIGIVILTQIEFYKPDIEPAPPALPVVKVRLGRPPKVKLADNPEDDPPSQ